MIGIISLIGLIAIIWLGISNIRGMNQIADDWEKQNRDFETWLKAKEHNRNV